MDAKKYVIGLLAEAGIIVNGNRSSDIQVLNEKLYARVLKEGTLGLGEAYMEGWWEVKELDEFFYRVLRSGLEKKVRFNLNAILHSLKCRLINQQTIARAFQIGEKHYDIGNDLYQGMLDPLMSYSCGYWKQASSLKEAQEAKLDLMCRKLHVRAGDYILDIGGGWGSFGIFAASRYGASVDICTVSKEQAALGKRMSDGLPVQFLLQDYRTLKGRYDHIVSVGMIEHVGYKNYRRYMEKVSALLKDDGLFLLHTIGRNKSAKSNDPWIEKYIFPNSMLPSIEQLANASQEVFVMEDWHNFGKDYDLTLMAWYENFLETWLRIRNNYDGKFNRMWRYYLLSCAGSFRARKNQVWQIVFSKHGVTGGYESAR